MTGMHDARCLKAKPQVSEIDKGRGSRKARRVLKALTFTLDLAISWHLRD